MYSRKTLEQVRDIVQDMGVTHYILENSWCVRKTRDGCQMPEIFDIEEPELAVGRSFSYILVNWFPLPFSSKYMVPIGDLQWRILNSLLYFCRWFRYSPMSARKIFYIVISILRTTLLYYPSRLARCWRLIVTYIFRVVYQRVRLQGTTRNRTLLKSTKTTSTQYFSWTNGRRNCKVVTDWESSSAYLHSFYIAVKVFHLSLYSADDVGLYMTWHS